MFALFTPLMSGFAFRAYRKPISATPNTGRMIVRMRETMFTAADRALFEAKREGRDKVVLAGTEGESAPQLVLNRVQPDHLVLGEGEESLPRVIARLENGEALPKVIGADDVGEITVRLDAIELALKF